MTKRICMQKIWANQSMNIWLKKREDAGIKHFSDPNAFIEYSNTMDDIYENINDYKPSRKRKVLLVFDDMIADIMANKNFQAIIKEWFIRCRKLNISLVLMTQSYFSVPKDVRLNSTYDLIMKINCWHWLTLNIMILWKFTDSAQKNPLIFWKLILHYRRVIL